jgi:transposase
MTPPVAVWGAPPLPDEERQALEHDYRYAKTRLVRQRSHILLLSTQLDSQSQVARVVGCSRATVARTLQLYQEKGRSALRGPVRLHQPRTRRTLDWQKALAKAMEQGPRSCGIDRPTWTAPLLSQYLCEQTGVGVGERSVRRGLSSLGYVCRRTTWVLRHKAEEQPDYHPKGKGSR